MPLSEREQRLLDQLERQLYDTDPELVRSLDTQGSVGFSWKRIVLSVCIGIVGLAVLLLGVSSQWVVVGVAGVAIMGAAVYLTSARPRAGRAESPQPKPAAQGRFLANLERRWDERER